MDVIIDKTGDLVAFNQAIQKALNLAGVQSLLLFVCDENGFSPECLDPILEKISLPVFGGVFPRIFDGSEVLERGAIIVAMKAAPEICTVIDMNSSKTDFEAELDAKIPEQMEMETLMVFVDGLCQQNLNFVDSLYTIFGLEINYIGGGGGSSVVKRIPCVITNHGLKMNHAVLAGFTIQSGVGVSHGWETLSGPYLVTESDDGAIKSLNWTPALQAYREVVEKQTNCAFENFTFDEISQAYPFGLAKMGTERVIRAPFIVDQRENIRCLAEIAEGAYIDVMSGNKESMIHAAGVALERAHASFPRKSIPRLELVFDCFSRVFSLGDQFSEELVQAKDAKTQMVGVCSFGEIANSGRDYLEMYHNTIVVSFLE